MRPGRPDRTALRPAPAAEWAAAQVVRVRDSPAQRIALLDRTYRGPWGCAPRHLP